MKNKERVVREPRFQVVKRDDMVWYKSWAVHIIAVLFALIICGFVVVMLTG
ncbi:MAG: ABC transporter permease, partial [Ruminococcaceae bacterium]|nr:ABC transporter permease [Oscillospiraceae bacterium]